MSFDDLIKTYGSQADIARAFGLSRASVNRWAKTGKMPQGRVWQVQAGAVKPPEKPLQPISGKGKGKVAGKE